MSLEYWTVQSHTVFFPKRHVGELQIHKKIKIKDVKRDNVESDPHIHLQEQP